MPRPWAATAGALLAPGRAERIRRVAAGCARTVTGYLSGTLLISFVAGN